eukprot:g2120.t1
MSANKTRVEYATLFSILCTMAGTGILQLPFTLKQGGWLCLTLLFIVALMTNTTGKWLIHCLYESSNNNKELLLQPSKRLNDYPSIGEAAYGTSGRILVQIFHKSTLVGVTTIFLILAGKFLMEGIGGSGEGFVPNLGTAEDASEWQTRWTLITAGIVAVPVTLIPNMSEMHSLALFGLLCTVLCVIEIVVFAFLFKPIQQQTVIQYNLPVPTNFNSTHFGKSVSHSYFNINEFPTSFAAITLSFGGHAVFPSIEKHMEDPNRNFNRTFNFAYLILLSVYLLAAIFGYLTFGDITYSPILCNFPRDTSTILGTITATTKLMIAFHVMSAYPILMNVVCTELEQTLGIEGTNRGNEAGGNITNQNVDTFKARSARFFLRISLVALTCFVAVMVPYFPDVMSLVGAMCLTMIVFVLPVAFSFKLRGDKMSILEKVWGLCIVCCGCIGGIIGTIQAFQSIASKLLAGAPPG